MNSVPAVNCAGLEVPSKFRLSPWTVKVNAPPVAGGVPSAPITVVMSALATWKFCNPLSAVTSLAAMDNVLLARLLVPSAVNTLLAEITLDPVMLLTVGAGLAPGSPVAPSTVEMLADAVGLVGSPARDAVTDPSPDWALVRANAVLLTKKPSPRPRTGSPDVALMVLAVTSSALFAPLPVAIACTWLAEVVTVALVSVSSTKDVTTLPGNGASALPPETIAETPAVSPATACVLANWPTRKGSVLVPVSSVPTSSATLLVASRP